MSSLGCYNFTEVWGGSSQALILNISPTLSLRFFPPFLNLRNIHRFFSSFAKLYNHCHNQFENILLSRLQRLWHLNSLYRFYDDF